MMHLKLIIVLCSLSTLISAADISGKKWSFDLTHGKRKIKVWAYQPKVVAEVPEIVFVMHGTKRNAETYLEPWIAIAERHKAYVLVPEFSKEDWPGSRAYNYGNVFDSKGSVLPKDQWSYTAIDAIFQKFRLSKHLRTTGYSIFGHSAGSQFVHRMVILGAGRYLKTAVAANAGSYTMTDFEIKWPFGLKDTPVTKSSLKTAFSKHLHIAVGEKDIDINHKYLPHSEGAKAQGKHRLERGKNFFSKV